MVDSLRRESLNWALAHLRRYGDTDLLPVPFEYEAIAHDWHSVGKALEQIDLDHSVGRPQQHFLVPKVGGGYRVATRLDPLDAILYTAAVYEIAPTIEAGRVDLSKGVACSYRINLDDKGSFFATDNGWHSWTERINECASALPLFEGQVVTADIADFYSQISTHAVANALTGAGADEGRARNIERMLLNWTGLQSRGLPVGPHASIILAEACLNDVDRALDAAGYTHTRYVDDFRLFCRDRTTAERCIHDLAALLFSMHRLSLSPSKTKIHESTLYQEEQRNPEFIARAAKADRVEALVAHVYGQVILDPLATDASSRGTESPADGEVLRDLFDVCVAQEHLHLGLARYLFRRAAQLRTNTLIAPAIKNMSKLVPVLRDTLNYLSKQNKDQDNRIASALIHFSIESPHRSIPYVQEWLLHVLTTRFPSESTQRVRALAAASDAVLGIRHQAASAVAGKEDFWVRQRKANWQSLGPWDRRAVIRAGSTLPAAERGPWKALIVSGGDLLDRAVAKFALQ